MPFSTPSLFDDSTRDLGADTDPAVPSKMPHTQRMRPPMETVLPPLPIVPTPTAFLTIAPPQPRLLVETPSLGPAVLSTQATPAPFTPRPLPRRRTTALLVAGATATILVGITIGGLLGLRDRLDARATAEVKARPPPPPALTSAPALASAPAPASASAPALTSALAPASAPAPAPAPPTGRLLTDPSEKGHRIFLDGRVAGTGGAPLTVRCGKHDVRVGSAGQLRRVDIPCGGDVEVSR